MKAIFHECNVRKDRRELAFCQSLSFGGNPREWHDVPHLVKGFPHLLSSPTKTNSGEEWTGEYSDLPAPTATA